MWDKFDRFDECKKSHEIFVCIWQLFKNVLGVWYNWENYYFAWCSTLLLMFCFLVIKVEIPFVERRKSKWFIMAALKTTSTHDHTHTQHTLFPREYHYSILYSFEHVIGISEKTFQSNLTMWLRWICWILVDYKNELKK